MVKRNILFIMTVLMCWCGTLASEKEQVTNLFDGDSFAVLSEEQTKILDYAVKLICENDTIVVLPQELNLLIGDTTSVSYLSYPDWSSAYFINEKNTTHLIVPSYAETSVGIVRSKMMVGYKKDKFNYVIETKVRENKDTSKFSGVYMESNIEGNFLNGKIYKNGVVVTKIKDEFKKTSFPRNRIYFNEFSYSGKGYGTTEHGPGPSNFNKQGVNAPSKSAYTEIERKNGTSQQFIRERGN